MPLSPKSRLGTYEIVGPLGAGGMGEVYRARDLRLGRDVAVKVLPAEVATSPDRLARFEREAKTVAGLNHPNIVVLHSIEEENGIRFLTMELIEGQDLSNLVSPGGLSLPRLLEVAIPLTDALVAAHERGVIHRDLKPRNIMVTRQGRVKVLDFGLAKMSGNDASVDAETRTALGDVSISQTGQVVGTAPYMAPEQIRGETVDARSDLFALGIILYELAAGSRPFTGATLPEIASSILRDSPTPLTRVRADLPEAVERVVGQCLEKRRQDRSQTALGVGNDLRRIQQALAYGSLQKREPRAIPSIAVIPFVNRSHNVDDEYFSDGLADELLNTLAKIRGLRVAAQTSSFMFKGKAVPIQEVGRALNVATVLEGSVRKSGNRARISVQLVKVSDGYHLWSQVYDRTLDDLFAVQDDIAKSVVSELRTTLMGEAVDSGTGAELGVEVAKASRGRARNTEAHRLYLQARHLVDRVTREDSARGISYLKQALEQDPEYALAWAELGRAYAREASFAWLPVAEGFEQARTAVERALSLEPDLVEGHTAMAWIQIAYDWDWPGAERSVRRALELAPENSMAFRRAGVLARALGRLDEALGLDRRALGLDPLSAAAYHNLGRTAQASDRLAESEEAYRKALELAPQRAFTHGSLSLTLLEQRRDGEALAEARLEPLEPIRLWALAIICNRTTSSTKSDTALRALRDKYAIDAALQIAEVHATRGEANAAFGWLERAHAQRDPGLLEVKISPLLRALHGDPRWAAFLNKMDLND